MIQPPNARRGFTIVELMIVVIIIGILATIVGLNYQNATKTGRSSQAKSNAYAVQKVAEAFYADKNRVPTSVDDFSYNPLAKLPEGVTLLTGSQTLSSTNGQYAIEYTYITTGGIANGGRIRYFDFTAGGGGAVTSTPIYIADGKASSTGWTSL